MNSRLNFRLLETAQDCLLCGALSPGAMLCHGCHEDLPRIAAGCPRCGLPGTGEICGSCLRNPPAFDSTQSALRYAFPADQLVQALKYGRQLALARLFGTLLATAVRPATRPDWIVPLPLAPDRLRERGFNQAHEIARHTAAALGVPLAADLAVRVRATPPQALLALDERQRNIKNAFASTRTLDGAHLAIVDDVMTSGATLNEMAVTLKHAGAGRVDAWVASRTLTHI